MSPIQQIELRNHKSGLAYCMKMLDAVLSEPLQNKFLNQAIDHETAINAYNDIYGTKEVQLYNNFDYRQVHSRSGVGGEIE